MPYKPGSLYLQATCCRHGRPFIIAASAVSGQQQVKPPGCVYNTSNRLNSTVILGSGVADRNSAANKRKPDTRHTLSREQAVRVYDRSGQIIKYSASPES